jgi:hypothetical protein
VLIDVETGSATGFPGSSAQFFNMVRTHTLQGTFGDPYYGGNANFVGWDLLGYPGIRLNVSVDDQHLGAKLTPTHKSAYDTEMFTKASASAQGATADKQARHEPHSNPSELSAPSVALEGSAPSVALEGSAPSTSARGATVDRSAALEKKRGPSAALGKSVAHGH